MKKGKIKPLSKCSSVEDLAHHIANKFSVISPQEPVSFYYDEISGKHIEIKSRKDFMISKIVAEYERASKIHPPFNSAHEGYAIIKEEVDEMWDCIKQNEVDHARREAMQVCAMSLRFLIDIKPDPKSP